MVRGTSTAYLSPTTSGRFTKSTCTPSAARRRTLTPFGSLRGRVKASPFAMRVLSRSCATSAEEQASRFIHTLPSHARPRPARNHRQHQGRARDSRAFTSEHDSRSVFARRSACNGHCVGGGEVQHRASHEATLVALS